MTIRSVFANLVTFSYEVLFRAFAGKVTFKRRLNPVTYYFHNSGNNKDWSKIVHILEISCFKKGHCNAFHPKKNHLESINVAVIMLHLSERKRKVEHFELPQGFFKTCDSPRFHLTPDSP